MKLSYGRLAKLFSNVYSYVLFILLILFSYFIFTGIYLYYDSKDIYYFFNFIYGLLIIIYICVLSNVTNKIEQKLYKENFTGIIELLIIHAFLYGILTPLAFLDYYIIYQIIIDNNKKIFSKNEIKEKEYYLSRVLIKYGNYLFLIYFIYKYIKLYINIYNTLVNDTGSISYFAIVYFLFLIFALMQIKIADKELDNGKYLTSAIRCIIIGLLTNPITFHGPLLIAAGINIIYKDKNFEQIKRKISDIKNKYLG